MRILYIATDVVVPAKKGSSTHTIEVASSLEREGHEVNVLSRRGKHQSEREKIQKVNFIRVYRGILMPIEPKNPNQQSTNRNGSRLPRIVVSLVYDLFLRMIHAPYCAFKAIQLDNDIDFDVFLERGSSMGAGAIAAKLRHKPLVTELIDRNHSKISLLIAEKILAYRPDIPKISKPPHILEIVPAGANTELFQPKTGQEQEKNFVGYAGSFRSWHGVETILEAARLVIEQEEKARFILVGPASAEAKKSAKDLCLGGVVNFTGGIDYPKMPATLSECNLLLAPFNPGKDTYMKKHGFIFSPLKIFEYMALERTVIASEVDTVKDVICNNRTGVLVPPGDPEALASAIINLLHNPIHARRLSKRARKEVCKRYSWQAFSRRLDKILEGCSRNRPQEG